MLIYWAVVHVDKSEFAATLSEFPGVVGTGPNILSSKKDLTRTLYHRMCEMVVDGESMPEPELPNEADAEGRQLGGYLGLLDLNMRVPNFEEAEGIAALRSLG